MANPVLAENHLAVAAVVLEVNHRLVADLLLEVVAMVADR